MSVQVELRITFSNEGEIRVHGPIHDKILCFGLLELAKDAIKNYKPEEKQNIVVPTLVMPPKM